MFDLDILGFDFQPRSLGGVGGDLVEGGEHIRRAEPLQVAPIPSTRSGSRRRRP